MSFISKNIGTYEPVAVAAFHPIVCAEFRVSRRPFAVQRVNPRAGGYLDPINPVEAFGREVRAGELLGRIISPFTFEVLEELVSPIAGWLGYWARNYPVRPGDWAYGVIPKDHPSTRWVPRPNW